MPDSKAKTAAGKQRFVGKAMHEFKEGDMKSGSGQKVTNPKQAIAIALSQTGQSKPPSKRNGAGNRGAASSSPKSANARISNRLSRRLEDRDRR